MNASRNRRQRELRVARRPALESDDAGVAEAVQRRGDGRVVDLAGEREQVVAPRLVVRGTTAPPAG